MVQRAVVDVFVILERDGQVLLAERANTGYADGLLNVPSGKAEPDEDVIGAAIREAHEEVGVQLSPDQIRTVHVMQRLRSGREPRIGWFFAASCWVNEPVNAEPHKCAGIGWYPADRLPNHTDIYTMLGIAHYLRGEAFSVHRGQ